MAEAREVLTHFYAPFEEIFPAERARIVGLLVKPIDIGADSMALRLRVDGLSGKAREMRAKQVA